MYDAIARGKVINEDPTNLPRRRDCQSPCLEKFAWRVVRERAKESGGSFSMGARNPGVPTSKLASSTVEVKLLALVFFVRSRFQ